MGRERRVARRGEPRRARFVFASISGLGAAQPSSSLGDGDAPAAANPIQLPFLHLASTATTSADLDGPPPSVSASPPLCWLGGLHFKLPEVSLPVHLPALSSLPRPRFPPWKQEGQQHAQQLARLPSDTAASAPAPPAISHNTLVTSRHRQLPDEAESLCVEVAQGGRKRVYRTCGPAGQGFAMEEEGHTAEGRFRQLVSSYLLPQGFPDSVAPQYASYMFWRGVQYLFGGAMSVYTTTSLMGALGVAGKYGGEASAAINWVIKDGAGRLGRLLFARWGRELDCELKQFRLFGDLLMESGAALELATIAAPAAFLPLACTANLAKNLAAVAASSTRAPIYRTFALSNNLADITAKGESVANLADIVGTFLGIALSKAKLPLLPTFCVLSAGYLFASRREVDSVELPYLNRARLAYAMNSFLGSGRMPGIADANANEWLLPWGGYHQGRVTLGAPVDEACASPAELRALEHLYRGERYLLTYRADSGRAYVMLRAGASTRDYLRAAFSAHVLLHLAGGGESAAWLQHQHHQAKASARPGRGNGRRVKQAPDADAAPLSVATPAGWLALLQRNKAVVDATFPEFLKQAEGLGWNLQQTMLNPKETRLLSMQLSPLAV